MGALVESGAEVDARDGRGRTPLHVAARRDHLNAVKALMQASVDVNAVDELGWTPLDHTWREDIKALFRRRGGRSRTESA